MAIKYKKKKHKQNNIIYTVITAMLLCAVFLTMVASFYKTAEEEAYENLHMQTKQIKDDITLQLISDRENLLTMANFAAKLYRDGESYDLMFESFKPIGLIENIGILNPDNTFVTKAGSMDMTGRISFEDEKEKGMYMSGRVTDLTQEGNELIRSVVPITVGKNTVGILYGVIEPDKIAKRYGDKARELDAQLFIYDKESGNLIVDTVHNELGNISFLKDRKYNEGYSYEQMMGTENGFTSFRSAYKNEDLYLHYSTIEEIDWMIALGRYEAQVFAETHTLSQMLLFVFFVMMGIIVLYIIVLMTGDKRINAVTECASEVRRELLEAVDGQNNIFDALVLVCTFAKARSAIFFDTNGDDYRYIMPEYETSSLRKNERHYLKTELFRYAAELYKTNKVTVSVMSIKPNKHLLKTNPVFYNFMKENRFFEISFAAVVNNSNHITILGTMNPKFGKSAAMLVEKIAACFSMALYNKNHMNETEIAATTDSLTGALNRVSYKNDLAVLEADKTTDFACIFVDVNELHICNNKFGHAAGDEMLLYIAKALKDVFSGQKIYRIGGDEFLVFAKNTTQDIVKKNIDAFKAQLSTRNYHVAIGMSYRTKGMSTTEVVREAEVRMYEEKSLYYQNKEQQSTIMRRNNEYVQIKTGILEIDTMLSVLNENYNGIYRVSLDSDKARRILMPAYLKYNEDEEHFSALFSRYVSENVDPDYHRATTSFLNYEIIKRQLMEDKLPRIRYKKTNGERVVLSVYKLTEGNEPVSDTLWVFAKD